jgi:hypothetical protein
MFGSCRIFPSLTCSFFPDSSRVVQTPRQHAAMLRDQGGARQPVRQLGPAATPPLLLLGCSQRLCEVHRITMQRAAAALHSAAEAGEERLAAAAAAEVQRQEVEECRGWLRRGKPGGMSHSKLGWWHQGR